MDSNDTAEAGRTLVCPGIGNYTSEGPAAFMPILRLMTWCSPTSTLQDPLMQVAQLLFVVATCFPTMKHGRGVMHAILVIGHLIMSTWGWNVVASRLVFVWSLAFVVINMGQTIHVLYLIRPHYTDSGLDMLYEKLFQPYHVERVAFRQLVDKENCCDVVLHPGQAYAVSGHTTTERLAILITGEVSAIRGEKYLHRISPMEFLDSPEFESSKDQKEIFKISLVSRVESRYLSWTRANLEQAFLGDPHLATVMSTLVSRDIAMKVTVMGNKVMNNNGQPLDLRLLSLASGIEKPDIPTFRDEDETDAVPSEIWTTNTSQAPVREDLAGHFGRQKNLDEQHKFSKKYEAN